MLRKSGIDPDLVDLDAYIDSTLTLEENARIIMQDIKLMMPPSTKSTTKLNNFMKAVELWEKRHPRKKYMDGMKEAKTVFEQSELSNKNFDKWKESPNRYDIRGIDSKY